MSLWEKLGAFVFRDLRKSSISICRETSEFDAALGSPRNYGLSSLKPLSGGFPKNIPVGRGSSSEFGRNIPYPKWDISSTMHDSCPEIGWKIKQDLCSREVPDLHRAVTTWNVTSAPRPHDVTVPMAAK